MKIPFNKIRRLSTAELPGVVCDPTLIFEFVANPSYQLIQEVSAWLNISSVEMGWDNTRDLAAQLIKAVIVPDGTRYSLGTPEEIDSLVDQTDQDFIVNLLNGWNTRISLERIAEIKKLRPLSVPSPDNGERKTPQLAS